MGWNVPLTHVTEKYASIHHHLEKFYYGKPGPHKNAIKRVSWETLYGASTTNAKYNELLEIITYHIEKICPKLKKTIKPKKKQPFTLTEQLMKLRNDTLKAKNKFHMTILSKDKLEFTKIKNM